MHRHWQAGTRRRKAGCSASFPSGLIGPYHHAFSLRHHAVNMTYFLTFQARHYRKRSVFDNEILEWVKESPLTEIEVKRKETEMSKKKLMSLFYA